MTDHKIVNVDYETAMNSASKEVYTKGDVVVTETLIPQGYETCKVVFFVDSTEGHSFDSFADKLDAIKHADEVAHVRDQFTSSQRLDKNTVVVKDWLDDSVQVVKK